MLLILSNKILVYNNYMEQMHLVWVIISIELMDDLMTKRSKKSRTADKLNKVLLITLMFSYFEHFEV